MILADITPTHAVAQWFITTIRNFFNLVGLKRDPNLEGVLYLVVVGAVAVLLGYIIRKAILWITQEIFALRHSQMGPELEKSHLLTKCSHVIPPLVMLALVPFAIVPGKVHDGILKLVFIYLLVMMALAINAIVDFAWFRYDSHENVKNLPLKGIAATLKGVIWIITVIIMVSVIINRSPTMLLTGLGAFAAALMLVFKDSILGLVAAIQLSQNDLLRIGDWIVVPGTEADGTVEDMSLSAVKIRNFDNTIVTCPPYKLVQSGFKNWRGMFNSGVRRIDYNLTVENSTIVKIDDAFITHVAALYPSLKPWVASVRAAANHNIYDGGISNVNGSIETNLGLFRALVCLYLKQHPQVSQQHQMLVRLDNPVEQGTTLNIYCFTLTTHWAAYEAILSQILEWITAAGVDFGLRFYTPVTGVVGTSSPQAPTSTSAPATAGEPEGKQ